MKKLLILAFVLLSSVFFASCGEDETKSYTYDEYLTKNNEVFCEKIYSCDEGASYKAFLGENKDTCVEKMNEGTVNTDDGECKGYDGELAAECMECMENLSCSDFFNEMNGQVHCSSCYNMCKEKK